MVTITTTPSPTLSRLKAAAALIPFIQSGLADSKLSRDRAACMAAFVEWAANITPVSDVEQRLVDDLTASLSDLKAAIGI